MSDDAPTLGSLDPTDPGLETRRQLEAIHGRLFGGEAQPVTAGRFVLLEPLGHGGMGVVYTAYDPQLDRRVAVKVLRGHGGDWTERGSKALLREAQAMAKLVHPNVITVYEAVEMDDAVFIAMELVEGDTLGQWCKANPPGTAERFRQLLDLAVQAARGLVAAHEAGLVHRDLKPANMLIGQEGRLRIADFGLARAAQREELDDAVARTIQSLEATTTASVAGTPAYMPPEQFDGQADTRSDQWSLCATLWEAAYGSRPFAGDTVAALMDALESTQPEAPPERAEVPRWFRDALLRGLAADPEARHPEVRNLLRILERGRRSASQRGWWAAGIITAILGSTLAAVGLSRDGGEACPRPDAERELLWGKARRDGVQQAFSATGRPHAASTFSLVGSQVEARADAIGAMRRDSCLATRSGEQSQSMLDLRSNCLDVRRRRLDAILGQWEQGIEPAALDEAGQALDSLTPVSFCADEDLLLRAFPPPPAEQAEAVEQLEAEIDEAHALVRAGREDQARARLGDLVERTKALDYPPTVARALRLQGRLEAFGDPVAALTTYEAASAAAAKARDPEVEVGTWLGIANALSAQHRYGESQWALRAAELAVQRAGSGPYWRSALAYGRAVDAAGRGEVEEALAAAEENLAVAREEEDPPGLKVARALYLLGQISADRGDAKATVEHTREALAVFGPLLSDGHPLVAAARLQLGMALLRVGQTDEGTAEVEAARAAWVAVYGENHRHVAGATMVLAGVLSRRGAYDEALAQYDRALAIFEATGGPDDANVALVLSNRGLCLRDAGRHQEAERDLLRSLKIRETALGPKHPAVAESVTNLANLEWARDDFEAAVVHHRRALEIKREAMDPKSPAIGVALLNLGMTELRLERYADACVHYEEAIALLEPAKHPSLAVALAGGGEAALAAGKRDQAVQWLEASLALEDNEETRALLARAR